MTINIPAEMIKNANKVFSQRANVEYGCNEGILDQIVAKSVTYNGNPAGQSAYYFWSIIVMKPFKEENLKTAYYISDIFLNVQAEPLKLLLDETAMLDLALMVAAGTMTLKKLEKEFVDIVGNRKDKMMI